ncbi:hypothetical protein COBT_000573 [Conglomerata obtusa]
MLSKSKNIVKRSNSNNEIELMNAISSGADFLTEDEINGYFRNMATYIPRCMLSEVIRDLMLN